MSEPTQTEYGYNTSREKVVKITREESEREVKQAHNRYITGVDNSHPADESAHKVTWNQSENVRRYRILPIGGTGHHGGAAGDYIRVVEDAPNGAIADAFLAEASAPATDVEYWVAQVNQWSEWKELSKSDDDASLSRLDFEASAAGPFTIFVEAE